MLLGFTTLLEIVYKCRIRRHLDVARRTSNVKGFSDALLTQFPEFLGEVLVEIQFSSPAAELVHSTHWVGRMLGQFVILDLAVIVDVGPGTI